MTNYSKFSGDDVTLNLTFKDSVGVAINITGYTVYFIAKRNKYDADAIAVISKAITSHTDAANGQTQIALTNTETALLKGSFYYSMQYLTGVGGTKKTIDTGVITFKEK
jgi:hypothetical protein